MLASLSSLRRLVSGNPRGYLCVLGSFLLSLALSLDYSYPNLNTYITSYLRENGSDNLTTIFSRPHPPVPDTTRA